MNRTNRMEHKGGVNGMSTSMKVSLRSVYDNQHRLREIGRDEAFYQLVESLRNHGLVQPIKVRPRNDGFELVYGHRRVAAMRQLGWEECEAIIEDINDDEALLQAVMENLHREDLTAFEEAQIYASLQEKGHTLAQIAKLVSKPNGHITTRLSLLRLPTEVQRMVQPGRNQQVAATELDTISIDSASRIASATETPDEAIAVAQKAVRERLTRNEIRDLTGRLKRADTPEQREQVLTRPFSSYEVAKSGSGMERQSITTVSIPFHASSRSVSEQFHSKLVWNLGRIDLERFSHFTIGYSQRSWEQVEELLKLARVTTLVDARKNPVSQYKPEFSKTSLQCAANSDNIAYQHIPELGIGSEDRAILAETHEYDRLFTAYAQRLTKEYLISLLGDKLETERLVFFCVELDPNTCHRHCIALLLEEMGFPTLDL